jgi:hypothetical protein
MPAFISHSFENKPEFENVTDAFELRGVPFWNPAEIRSGASLREQLRAAESSALCASSSLLESLSTQAGVEPSWAHFGAQASPSSLTSQKLQ